MRPITHVNDFALKDDEHHALCTAHIPEGFQRSTDQPPNCSTRRTLYAHSAMGSPTNADKTNQPDGGSALAVGCARKPASGPALRREKKNELEAVLVIEEAQIRCLALRSLRQAKARSVIHGDIDVRTKRRTQHHHISTIIIIFQISCDTLDLTITTITMYPNTMTLLYRFYNW